MNIKQSVTLLFLLMGVSFSAFSLDRINSVNYLGEFCGLSVGDVIDPSKTCVGKVYQSESSSFKIEYLIYCDKYKKTLCVNSYNPHPIGAIASVTRGQACPQGQELNPDTGKCEEPPSILR